MEPHDETGEVSIKLLPPVFFGNIFWYYHLLHGAQVRTDEPYRKQTLRNRMEICGPQGRQALSVPVSFHGLEERPQALIPLVYDAKTRTKHLRTLRTAYGSAPFFIHYFELFEDFFSTPKENLLQLNLGSFELMRMALPDLPKSVTIEGAKSSGDTDPGGCFKTRKVQFKTRPYAQIFEHKFGYEHNLSIVDVLMHLGPETTDYLATGL